MGREEDPMIQLTKIGHVKLRVADVQRSEAWPREERAAR
jgi:catechol-2,3-dioxygenase